MKYYVNCKHYLNGGLGSWCQYNFGDISLVDGKSKPKFAHTTRADEGMCGAAAKWFEEKHENVKEVPFWKRLFK